MKEISNYAVENGITMLLLIEQRTGNPNQLRSKTNLMTFISSNQIDQFNKKLLLQGRLLSISEEPIQNWILVMYFFFTSERIHDWKPTNQF